MPQWDSLIRGGLLFDGSGRMPTARDVAIVDGSIAAIGDALPPDQASSVVDASGRWVMPGLIDLHTHYDLEVELAPGLPESVRHGTTTVVMSNCSLGLAFGAQRLNGDDPIVSCFARVENMPKSVIKRVADIVTWDNPADYLDHLDSLPLGPNIVPMIPHSMLRIEVMGLEESVSRDPTRDELVRMKALLDEGLQLGFAGFSTDALPFHFLANDPYRERRIPTQFAKYGELKALTDVVREHGRVWQATPPKDSPVNVFRIFALCSEVLHGKPLKTTVVAAMDVSTNRTLIVLARILARLMNSPILKGQFHLQALAAPFRTWSDGFYSPLSEEIEELRELIELDMEDREGRMRLLSDLGFIKRFKTMWMKGKSGVSLDRLKRLARLEQFSFDRNVDTMLLVKCPVRSWEGRTFGAVFADLMADPDQFSGDPAWQGYRRFFSEVEDEADFVLAAMRAFDIDVVWSTVSANKDPERTRELVMDPLLLPGFNDSGAHLTNMAFYDCNLRALKLASEGGLQDTSFMVRRLTKDAAELFGLDAGTIAEGARADITVIDPEALERYDGEAGVHRIHRDVFDHEQLVNRSDGVVSHVMIGGRTVWTGADFVPGYGQDLKAGSLLRVSNAS